MLSVGCAKVRGVARVVIRVWEVCGCDCVVQGMSHDGWGWGGGEV